MIALLEQIQQKQQPNEPIPVKSKKGKQSQVSAFTSSIPIQFHAYLHTLITLLSHIPNTTILNNQHIIRFIQSLYIPLLNHIYHDLHLLLNTFLSNYCKYNEHVYNWLQNWVLQQLQITCTNSLNQETLLFNTKMITHNIDMKSIVDLSILLRTNDLYIEQLFQILMNVLKTRYYSI
jgi:hypothetical protein